MRILKRGVQDMPEEYSASATALNIPTATIAIPFALGDAAYKITEHCRL
jgi:hypothetical protein